MRLVLSGPVRVGVGNRSDQASPLEKRTESAGPEGLSYKRRIVRQMDLGRSLRGSAVRGLAERVQEGSGSHDARPFDGQLEEVLVAADQDVDGSGHGGVKDWLVVGIRAAHAGCSDGCDFRVNPFEELLERR